MATVTARRTGNGRQTDLLKQFHLSRNPFVDRTAEKTELDDVSLYIHSDLQGFKPSGGCCALVLLPARTSTLCRQLKVRALSGGFVSKLVAACTAAFKCLPCAHLRGAETTYLFFGRRGSGKTTIRMQVGSPQSGKLVHSAFWAGVQPAAFRATVLVCSLPESSS